MDVKVVDHYKVLGLPSGKKGAKLGKKDISKAYRAQALQLHPDKRPNDPNANANANFKRITLSYEVLKDPIARKLFDCSLGLRVLKRDLEQHQHQCQQQHQLSATL